MNSDWCLLYDKFIDGDLTDHEQRLVAELHESDETFRVFWRDAGVQYSLLATQEPVDEIKSFLSATLFLDEKIRNRKKSKNYFSVFLKIAAAIFFIAVPVAGYYFYMTVPSVVYSTKGEVKQYSLVMNDIKLGALDSMMLQKGAVEIAVNGPAEFRIGMDGNIKLKKGSIHVNTYSKGSVIVETAQGVYSDIGTEFGLEVNDGYSEVHVFDGSVLSPGQQKVQKGTALKNSDGVNQPVEIDRGKFVSFSQINDQNELIEKYLRDKNELINSPDVIDYFDFTELMDTKQEISGIKQSDFSLSAFNTGIAKGPFPGTASLDILEGNSYVSLTAPENLDNYSVYVEFYHQKFINKTVSILADESRQVKYSQSMAWYRDNYGKKGYLDERFWRFRGQLITIGKNYYISSNLNDVNNKFMTGSQPSKKLIVGSHTDLGLNFKGSLSRIIIFKNNKTAHLKKLFNYMNKSGL